MTLAQAHGGDIRRRAEVRLQDASEISGGRAFQVMAAYETWLAREHEQGARELAALRLLGLFDRPADAGCLAALRQAPPIPDLTEPLVDLSTPQWNVTLSRLAACGLIERGPTDGAGDAPVDAHPLVREYLAARLRERHPDAWREGHRRLYEHLKASAPHRPDGLAGLAPLYQAVAHGCLAGLHWEACAEVYRDRILRGTGRDGFYSTDKIGAFGADLGALGCFFEVPWHRVSSSLSEGDQGWILSQAANYLRAAGRLTEALEPTRAGFDSAVRFGDWTNAARRASNLSELELSVGRVVAAVQDGERAVELADHSGVWAWRIALRTTLADALHHQGKRQFAYELFRDAEAMQAASQPRSPLLYSLWGFRFCDLLLGTAERTAWRRQLTLSSPGKMGSKELLLACQAVQRRAEQTLKVVEPHHWLLDIAADHLTRGRALMLQAALNSDPSTVLSRLLKVFCRIRGGSSAPTTWDRALALAGGELTWAVDGLRAAGVQEFIVRGLLPRAWLHALRDDPAAARADLDDAWRIASRGGMRLFMADIHLHRARLFRDKAELAEARALIEVCGYGRRNEELQDAELAAAEQGWPESGASDAERPGAGQRLARDASQT